MVSNQQGVVNFIGSKPNINSKIVANHFDEVMELRKQTLELKDKTKASTHT